MFISCFVVTQGWSVSLWLGWDETEPMHVFHPWRVFPLFIYAQCRLGCNPLLKHKEGMRNFINYFVNILTKTSVLLTALCDVFLFFFFSWDIYSFIWRSFSFSVRSRTVRPLTQSNKRAERGEREKKERKESSLLVCFSAMKLICIP